MFITFLKCPNFCPAFLKLSNSCFNWWHWKPYAQLITLFFVSSWTTSGLKSQGRLSVGSNRDREISMSVGLGRSQLDSKGGVVGGTIDVNALEMVGMLKFYNRKIYWKKVCESWFWCIFPLGSFVKSTYCFCFSSYFWTSKSATQSQNPDYYGFHWSSCWLHGLKYSHGYLQ